MEREDIAKNLLEDKVCDTCRVEQIDTQCEKLYYDNNDCNFYDKPKEKTCKFWLDYFE